jgi:hypothetical protein
MVECLVRSPRGVAITLSKTAVGLNVVCDGESVKLFCQGLFREGRVGLVF